MKKLRNLLVFLSCIFILFLIVSITPKDYKYQYELGKIKITEIYQKKDKVYLFTFEKNSSKYEYSVSHKYIRKRGLIDKVSINDDCLIVKSKLLDDFSVCQNDNGYYTIYTNDKIIEDVTDNYELVNIYDLKNRQFYIWNYTEFLAINKDEKQHIELFDDDIYELEIITKLNNHLVVADYNQKYKFNKMYLINSKNNETKEIELDKDIYFNSYILGTYKKSLYIYDLQKEKEYKVNPFKGELEKISYEIRVNKEWQSVSVNKLNKKNMKFEETQLFYYEIEDGNLYYNMPNAKILVTNMVVTNIVESNEKEAFYISEDTLYYIHFDTGISKVMQYSEWKFTSNNIYIF